MEDFSAKSGSYNAPYLTENQADTLSGVFDATFLEYPKDKAKELFGRIVELVPSAPQVMTMVLTTRFLKTLSSCRLFHRVLILGTGSHSK